MRVVRRRRRRRRRAGRSGDEPSPRRGRARSRRARTRRGGIVVAHRALGLAQAAHPELDVPPARAPVRGDGPRRLPDGGRDRRLARGIRRLHRRPGPHGGHGAAGASRRQAASRSRPTTAATCAAVVVATGASSEPRVPASRPSFPRAVAPVDAIVLPEPGAARRHGRRARGRGVGIGRADRGRAATGGSRCHRLRSASTSGSRGPTEAATSTAGWTAIGQLDERYDEVEDIERARRHASVQLVGTRQRVRSTSTSLSSAGGRPRRPAHGGSRRGAPCVPAASRA